MINKLTSLARALAILLSVIVAFVAIPNLDAQLALVVLGLVAGISYGDDQRVGLILTAVVLPLVAPTLSGIPAIGASLGSIASNVGVAAAAAVASSLAISLFNTAKDDLMGLAK
jgi:hypothetical protein